MSEEITWIRKIEEIPTASNESLIQSLITCDGNGKQFKTAALEELLMRAERDMYKKDNENFDLF